MKAQFLKMAGVNSEDEFYNMFPTEESFFQAYPEARNYANGGATYPYPGQATADQFFNYGMQGKGAGAQIPVETYYAYGGSSNGPLGYFEDGGMGQNSSPFNYGAFPAFAQKGNQVQGGGIDAATGTIKDNFLAAIQKNVNKAMLDQETEQALEMNQEMMPQLIAQYGAEAGSMFMPNMYNQDMFEDRYNQLNQENADSTRNMMGLAKFFTNNLINRKLDSITEQQKRDEQMKSELGTDAQTVPEFNSIPDNMAKYGGSLKKYQTGSQTEDPFLAQIQKMQADLAKEKLKAKTDAEQAKLTALKNAVNTAIKNYNVAVIPFGDWKSSRELGLGITDQPTNIASKEVRAQEIVNAYNAYNNYAKSIGASTTPTPTTPATETKPAAKTTTPGGQVYDSSYGVYYTPIKSQAEYQRELLKANKTPEDLARQNAWAISKENKTYQTQSQTGDLQAPAAAPDTPTPAKAPAKPAPKAPAPQAKPKVDTIIVDEYFKKGGNKFDKGGVVKIEQSKQTNHVRTTYEDGTIEITDEAGNIISTTTAAKKEGVPPMSYKPDMNPILGETHSQWAGRNGIPGGGWNGAALANKVWDGKQWVDPAGTTTPAATTGEMSPEEKAVRDFAIAKGQNPDEVWQNYQMITSSYGTMGAGTQQPYGYGVSTMVPYRYKHRGYGSIGWDRGYVPEVGDLAAMQEQANRMGYEFYGKSRPTLFGGRKVVIKTKYNPSTGKVERAPEVENEAPKTPSPTWGVNQQAPSPLLTDMDRYNLDKEQAIKEGQEYANQQAYNEMIQAGIDPVAQARLLTPIESTMQPENVEEPTLEQIYRPTKKHGGLHRFLPKHQVLGETGFKFDNLDINIPIMDTFHDIKTGLTSIKDFKQQRADARREKRGTDEKAVWKTGPSPYAADTVLTGMSALTNIAKGKERKALEEQMATGKLADNLFTSVEKKRGDYVPTGQEYGMFRPDQTTPIFDTGYDRGYANRPTYSYDRGGSIAYSDWSQTPVNGYYGIPTGEMSMYSQWTQAPVRMQQGGVMSEDGIEMELTPEEIEYITQMGGQVEFLD